MKLKKIVKIYEKILLQTAPTTNKITTLDGRNPFCFCFHLFSPFISFIFFYCVSEILFIILFAASYNLVYSQFFLVCYYFQFICLYCNCIFKCSDLTNKLFLFFMSYFYCVFFYFTSYFGHGSLRPCSIRT